MFSRYDDVPTQVWDDLEYEIARNELDYADNYRAYRKHDGHLKQDYSEAEKSGCCGMWAGTTKVDGDEWVIGCNYGH